MNILLTGASGFIGRHIREALGRAGHLVTPVSRRDGIDMTELVLPQRWVPHLNGIDAVINAVGIIGETRGQTFSMLHDVAPRALFEACAQAGVKRVVQISALGADDRAFTAYHLSKRAADEALRQSPLEWFVLRPSLVHGPGGTSSAMFLRLARLPVIPVIGDGRQRIQPVHIDDLVATVMRCVSAPQARRTLDVVGPEVFGFVDWLQRLRATQGLPLGRVFHAPYALALGLAALCQPFTPLLSVDNLRMLQAGNVADVAPLAAFLGHMPRAAVATPWNESTPASGDQR